MAPKLIATSDELEEIARSDETDVPVLRGWRRKLFGDDALALKRGELALVIKKGESDRCYRLSSQRTEARAHRLTRIEVVIGR